MPREGVFARVEILPRAKDDVVVVPLDAIRRVDGRTEVLVLRDDAYGMIKWKQANMGLPNFGLDFGNPDRTSLGIGVVGDNYVVTLSGD